MIIGSLKNIFTVLYFKEYKISGIFINDYIPGLL